MRGKRTIKTWSSGRHPVIVWRGRELRNHKGFGVRSLCSEVEVKQELIIHTDSTAAQGIGTRTGTGKIKHSDVQQLWVGGPCRLDDEVLPGRGHGPQTRRSHEHEEVRERKKPDSSQASLPSVAPCWAAWTMGTCWNVDRASMSGGCASHVEVPKSGDNDRKPRKRTTQSVRDPNPSMFLFSNFFLL